MKFDKLKLSNDKPWFERVLASEHIRKTVLYVLGGAAIGAVAYFFTEAQETETLIIKDLLGSAGTGALFGFLITNSPCARGKC